MPLIDSLLSVIAPHNCLGCGWEGSLLCVDCTKTLPLVSDTKCIKCSTGTTVGMLCMICRTTSFLTAIKIRTTHEGAAKQLIHSLKFERAYAAALPVAEALCQLLPNSFADSHDVVVVPVPTASSRVRARGYDQAAVIAKRVAKQSKLPCQALLRRATQTRQVGASREQRLTQLKTAFYVRKPSFCTGRTILLIDDVLTTGSTFEACAEVLRSAGATRVFGLAFAWQPRK